MANFFRFLSVRRPLKRVPEPPASAVVDYGLIAEALPVVPSRLLKDVLADGPAAVVPANAPLSPPPLSQKLSVGSLLGKAKQQAVDAASMLSALVDGESAQLLQGIVHDLEQRVCRIAFAGQMNAGKSSLINVLVEQAELLPADINPWTTVVTKLHFGVPGASESGASFTFFSADEWQRLSIGGRTRELTERILPDFDWDTLNQHVEAMQSRAAQKLGPRFQNLLGTEHSYAALTPGLLNRYVGAGLPGRDESAETFEGEFSDITKLANVFFDLGAFNFPTILIDTPGVNDPFLVRDEITRQSLEAVDICVIVLTARQPLSTADLHLLRMLRGLNKSRLIIFINKIDHFDGGKAALDDVSNRVSTILREEFPSADIPVIYGSALWARAALFPSRSTMEISNDNQIVGGVAETLENAASNYWPGDADLLQRVTIDTLFQKSGLSSLVLAISELMRTGPVADAVKAAAGLIEALSQNLIACSEAEIAILEKVSARIPDAEDELAALTALTAALSEKFEIFRESLAQNYTRNMSALHRTLTEAVTNSISEHFATRTDSSELAQLSHFDLKLRVKLENTFLSAFEDAAKSVLAEQEQFKSDLTAFFDSRPVVGPLAVMIGDKVPPGAQPSIAALSEPVALGLSCNRWHAYGNVCAV